ncbi:hypothetical protein F5887DRAFT_972047, partial [Amanita rubescens]
MPRFKTFHASIKVDDKALPEYDVQVDENEKQVSCWVPSEAGKCFSVCWANEEPVMDTGGYVSLDGFGVGGTSSAKGWKKGVVHCNYITSSTTARNFRFSTITFTDDDAYLNAAVASLGEIKAEIWTIADTNKKEPGNTQSIDPVATSNVKVHERSKKVGTHRVQFGDLKEIPRQNVRSATKVNRLATFIFRYRPLGILQANGIAPLPSPMALPQQNNKRKSPESDTEERELFDEDEIERQVKELKDKLERLESRRAKRTKVKVEKREHSPLLNEVIDL